MHLIKCLFALSGVTWDVCRHVAWQIFTEQPPVPVAWGFLHKTLTELSSIWYLRALLTIGGEERQVSGKKRERTLEVARDGATCWNLLLSFIYSPLCARCSPPPPVRRAFQLMRWWLWIPWWLVAWARRRKRPNESTPRSRNNSGETKETQEGNWSCFCWVSLNYLTRLAHLSNCIGVALSQVSIHRGLWLINVTSL